MYCTTDPEDELEKIIRNIKTIHPFSVNRYRHQNTIVGIILKLRM